MIPGLLVLVALLHYAPEHVAAIAGGTEAAWAYVASGIEACALWFAVGLSSRAVAVRAVAAWGAFESFERAACRLAFPMNYPPRVGGQNLCSVATGMDTQWLGFLAALFVAALVREARDERR